MQRTTTLLIALLTPLTAWSHAGHGNGVVGHSLEHAAGYLLLVLLAGAIAVSVRQIMKRRD